MNFGDEIVYRGHVIKKCPYVVDGQPSAYYLVFCPYITEYVAKRGIFMQPRVGLSLEHAQERIDAHLSGTICSAMFPFEIPQCPGGEGNPTIVRFNGPSRKVDS